MQNHNKGINALSGHLKPSNLHHRQGHLPPKLYFGIIYAQKSNGITISPPTSFSQSNHELKMINPGCSRVFLQGGSSSKINIQPSVPQSALLYMPAIASLGLLRLKQ